MLTVSKDLLGEGFSARVYKGFIGNRVVAVKVFRESERAKRLFHQELRVLTRLSHASVPKVLGFGFMGTTPTPFLVTDLCGGETLEVSKDTTARESISRQLFQVVAYLHSRRVVHRDLTPANIIVSFLRPGRVEVRVVDFGFAVVLPQGCETFVDDDDRIVGTPGFLAPEILERGEYSTASDVYALGKTLSVMKSRLLGSLVARCTAVCPENRPTAASLLGRWPLYTTTVKRYGERAS